LFGAKLEDQKEGSKVLVCLHGANTDGQLWELLHEWALANRIVIVSPSLPGWGLSTANRGYRLRDWVKDIEELIQHLKISSFHIMGASLGSGHAAALACVFEPAASIQNVVLYVAFAPEDKQKKHDPLAGSMLKSFALLKDCPRTLYLVNKFLFLPLLRRTIPKGSNCLRSFKWQWEGMLDANGLLYQPWNFDWKNMASRGGQRKVTIVSGKKDQMCLPRNQKILAETIVSSTLIEYDGDHGDGLANPKMLTGHLDQAL